MPRAKREKPAQAAADTMSVQAYSRLDAAQKHEIIDRHVALVAQGGNIGIIDHSL